MNRISLAVSVAASLFIVSACSKDNAAPAAPTTPTTTAVTIASSGSNVFIGETLQMTASANLSNGQTQTPTCAWNTDAPSVATINSTGIVTGVSAGEATVWCDSSGRVGSKKLRALPNYGGSWSGNYSVGGCSQSGQVAAANICGSATTGTSLPWRWSFTQGSDVVAGSFFLGTLAFNNVSATVPIGGGITFSSRNASNSSTLIDVTWQANIPRANALQATLVQVWTSTGLSGQAVITGTVSSITSHTAFFPDEFSRQPGSLRDALQMVFGR